MSRGCSLKTAFVASKLDLIQPNWRNGSDVTQETKNKIQSDAQEKYGGHLAELFEYPDESISLKSVENAVTRARKKLGIVNPKGKRKNSPVRGSYLQGTNLKAAEEDNGYKEVHSPQSGEKSIFISNLLFDEIKRLVCQFSLEEVKKAISILEKSIFQNRSIPCSADQSEREAESVNKKTDSGTVDMGEA